MWRKLTHNWGLKLGSVIFAIMLWVIVTNINDPVITYKVYNVPVKITNTDVITSKGEVFEVLDDTDSIDVVTITASRSVIDSLSDGNVIATADMRNLTMQDTIAIKLSTNKYNDKLESIKGSIDTVKLSVEDKKTVTLALNTTTSGKVGSGYQIGDVTTEQNLVRISGPASVVDQVAKAGVDVDVTGFTSDIGTVVDIDLYDAEGNELSTSGVTMNISSVRVKVEILQTKNVPLKFSVSGTPAAGYQYDGVIESDPAKVKIAGKSAVIGKVKSIEIPAEALDITGKSENLAETLSITDYLPSGVKLAEKSFDGTVSVTVHIEKEAEKDITLKNSQIAVSGIPDGYKAELVSADDSYQAAFTGLAADVSQLSADNIKASADLDAYMKDNSLEQLTEGTYQGVPVTFTYGVKPAGSISLRDPVTVKLKITKNGDQDGQ
jgi:YbbR domain-containing protein